jgi:hypothetical protein
METLNMKLTIPQEIKSSLLCHNLRFGQQYGNARQWIAFKLAHRQITQVIWLTLSPVILLDCNTLYNPKTHIMLILN